MDEVERRRDAVRRRLAGEPVGEVAAALGRSTRWVRKWTARHEHTMPETDWARSRSRAPHRSPGRTPQRLRDVVLEIRARLEANPRSQYGALAIAWELRNLGQDPLPEVWTINRILTQAGVTKPRRRQPGYQSKGVPYPIATAAAPGEVHQADLVGPRHLDGGVAFHAFNLIDVGSHTVGNQILPVLRPPLIAFSLVSVWTRVGLPRVVQFDNHANLRGGIPPRASSFGPVVATCLDLGVTPRFAPLREPWRQGTIEHYNDVWDKTFFRATRFTGLDHLTRESAAFEAFHNARHRYSAHGGASPNELRATLQPTLPPVGYTPPTRLPRKGRIEAIRFIRSDRTIDLWGHKITVAADHTHQYVTAVIRVRHQQVTVVTRHGEILHTGPFPIANTLQ